MLDRLYHSFIDNSGDEGNMERSSNLPHLLCFGLDDLCLLSVIATYSKH